MSRILHYQSISGAPERLNVFGCPQRATEYIVITDDDDRPDDDFCRHNFRLARTYEVDDTGSLPLDRILVSDI